MISILVISRCAAPPYPAAPDFLHGKACHTILRSLCSLTNRVPLPPHPGEQNKTPRDNLLINPPLEMTVLADTPIVISTEAERSGEISPSDGTGGITVGDLSTQSIINAFSLCPIPTRSSARDDGGGERPPSFRPKRSGVEKSHSTMVHEALGWEISRLRASWERFPSAPYRHATPLEMTVVASALRHFDRSGAEWRNLTPPWSRKH